MSLGDQEIRFMHGLAKWSAAVALGLALALAASLAKADVSEIPQEIRDRLYSEGMLDPAQPIGESAYREWKAKNPGPWTIGYASSYSSNTWRSAVSDRIVQQIIPKWRGLGLLSDLLITQSNLDDEAQSQQVRQLVDIGADAIIVCCSHPTALNEAVEYAYENGVPVFSFAGYLASPYAINSSVNYRLAGLELGKWIADAIEGQGNILMVDGIRETSGSDSLRSGMLAGLEEYENVKVVGEIAGMWTDQIAQDEVQSWLAANSGQLDGIVVQSGAELGVLRALEGAGRSEVPVTIGGSLGALCRWINNESYASAAFHVRSPGDDFELIWNIMMRTLQGQGPKIQSILVDPVRLDIEAVKQVLGADCDPDSPLWLHMGQDDWGSDEYLDEFFLQPGDPAAYKP